MDLQKRKQSVRTSIDLFKTINKHKILKSSRTNITYMLVRIKKTLLYIIKRFQSRIRELNITTWNQDLCIHFFICFCTFSINI